MAKRLLTRTYLTQIKDPIPDNMIAVIEVIDIINERRLELFSRHKYHSHFMMDEIVNICRETNNRGDQLLKAVKEKASKYFQSLKYMKATNASEEQKVREKWNQIEES